MKDLLPNASIGISVTAINFLDQMATVAAESGALRPEKRYQRAGDILCLSAIAETEHEGLFGQLIYIPDSGDRIQVEVRARRWSGDQDPTYEAYVEALKLIFSDLLSAYNKKHGTRYRLTIETKNARELTLSPKAKEAFDSFVNLANMNGLHRDDWDCFYRFARICHTYRLKTNEENVFRLLVHAGFSEQYAREISTVFGHLRNFQGR